MLNADLREISMKKALAFPVFHRGILLLLGFVIVEAIACGNSNLRQTNAPDGVAYDIAYIEDRHLIGFMNESGQITSPISTPPDIEICTSGQNMLSWSLDGTMLAFPGRKDLNTDVYCIGADGLNLRRLTDDPARDEAPSWSADGQKIVFTSERFSGVYGYGRDVCLYDMAGNAVTRLTASSGFYESPAFSPDGAKIVFIHVISASQWAITRLDLASGTSTQVCIVNGEAPQFLKWAPVADLFIFSSFGYFGNVYSMRSDGTGMRSLTADQASAYNMEPAWYKDGKILFIHGQPGNFYVMNEDGSSKSVLHDWSGSYGFRHSPVYRFSRLSLPDLTVASYQGHMQAGDDSADYVIEFAVKNIGNLESGDTDAYIEAINPEPPPDLNEIRIQKRVDVSSLAPGSTTDILRVSFPMSEIHADEVTRLRITIDPKRRIKESNEVNNMVEWAW
ncbi:PD40 domain-containing protein [Candidatus Bathyarchaeota archaeon]|nr:PD40 domain-containing protein [Candidatus Bathyarchaeota archaeon]